MTTPKPRRITLSVQETFMMEDRPDFFARLCEALAGHASDLRRNVEVYSAFGELLARIETKETT